jgi:hypothetical protein
LRTLPRKDYIYSEYIEQLISIIEGEVNENWVKNAIIELKTCCTAAVWTKQHLATLRSKILNIVLTKCNEQIEASLRYLIE